MYSGASVAGRTRSRLALSEKQYLEKNSKRRKRNEGEESASYYAREEESSVDSRFDDDNDDDDDEVMIIGEHPVVNTLNDDEDGANNATLGDDNEKDVVSTSTRCIARRTRSHFAPSKFRDSKAGTISNPLCVDDEDEKNDERKESETFIKPPRVDDEEEESETIINHNKRRARDFDAVKIPEESFCGEEEVTEVPRESSSSSSDEKLNPKNTETCLPPKSTFGTMVLEPLEESEKGLDEIWAEMDESLLACLDSVQPPCVDDEEEESDEKDQSETLINHNKRRARDFDAVKILEESLCGEEEVTEVPCESSSSSSDEKLNPKNTETYLPPKPTFGTMVLQPLEESEKGLDEIWAEMDESLLACLDSVQVEKGHFDDPGPDDEVSRTTPCQRGDHDPILNEEIGVMCINCSEVIREIKFCDPPFWKNPWGKSGSRPSYSLENADQPFYDDLQHQFFGCDDDSSGFDPNTSTGTVWDKIPGVMKKKMFPHQKEAFKFLWVNLAGGTVLDKLKKHLDFAGGNGCIISHAPGTGKTLLTIVFLLAFMELYPNCRPMIIAPSNILGTWEKELERCDVGVPFHNLNKPGYSGKESEDAMDLVRQNGHDVLNKKHTIRVVKLYSWKKVGGILGISYRLFDGLARMSSVRNKESLSWKRQSSEYIKKALLELPGLLVLDEGHTPRNARSLIWGALSEIKTKRRIILTGTPFQNNFKELKNTLCLAKPKFVEGKGDLAYLLKSYGKVDSDLEKDQIVAKIRNMIEPFVHVHKGTVLQESLPGLRELVVRLKPSELQKKSFEYIQDEGSSNYLRLEHLVSLATVHPALVLVDEYKNLSEGAREIDGVKTIFVMELIRLCELMKEKVLVFSQYIYPLTFLANQIKSRFNWTEGKEMSVIDGKTHVKTRQASIDAFNDPTGKVRVMLASIRACFEGISLVGASRVVLLDILWNPSAERQAVSRAYRIGQKKVVYTYRLITTGSRDERKFSRQAEKDHLSESVFYCPDGAGHHQNISSVDLQDKILEKMVQNDKLKHIFEKITTSGGVSFLLKSAD